MSDNTFNGTGFASLLPAGYGWAESTDRTLPEVMHSIREHLGMDIAFIAELSDGKRIFREVDAKDDACPIRAGNSDPQEETYCQRIVDGRLPELIPNVSAVPEAASLPITGMLGIGSYMGVPIRLADGSVYGTFCCFSHEPDTTLNKRDLGMMRVFADIAARQIERDLGARRQQRESEDRIRSMLKSDELSIVYQPIVDLRQHRIAGFEALSRFAAVPARTPDLWFNEASQIGLGVPLEEKAIRAALLGFDRLPENVYVSINASPELILEDRLHHLLSGTPLERIVLEITEHVSIDRYQEIGEVTRKLRERGLRVAVDDAGAGYASFRHILKLSPDLIKLDISLTRNIDTDAPRRALASALIRFAKETGSKVIAEGVKTPAELGVLQDLGVDMAQGFLLGKPLPLMESLMTHLH
ncbi:sensor domain-containing phosphodiesterase [Noviherbaspirillum humi]|nr:EAL domain-containing protein [Noviherbaspirillum humi]